MKTRLIFLMLMFAFFTVNAQNKAAIKFDKTMHDFGKFKEEGGKVSTEFTFTNTGTEALTVSEAKPSCGCITTEWTKTPVEPGGKGTVKVFYDPFRRPGVFEKSVWIHSNASEAEVTINIKGEVIPKVKTLQDSFPVRNGNLMLAAQAFYLKNVTTKEFKRDSMLVYNPGTKPITIAFKNYPSYITCKAKPATLAPKQKGKLCITYDASKKKEYGMVTDTMTLATNDSLRPDKVITIAATIIDDFSSLTKEQRENAAKISFTSEFLEYGEVKSGEIIKKTFEFKNEGKDTLFIRKATPYREDCKVIFEGKKALAAGESGKITLEFNTAGKVGEEGRTILLTTNDPSRPFIILVMKGKLTQ